MRYSTIGEPPFDAGGFPVSAMPSLEAVAQIRGSALGDEPGIVAVPADVDVNPTTDAPEPTPAPSAAPAAASRIELSAASHIADRVATRSRYDDRFGLSTGVRS